MTQPPERKSSPGERTPGLDTLRALAIVLVFMYHYMCFVSGVPTFGWGSTLGWVGVDLFFVLSGYLIADQLFAGLGQGRALSLKAFYARRWLRTLPAFYVVLAAYWLWPASLGGNPPPPLWRFLSFTQNIQLQPGTAFSHAWSLCIEEQFYLLLPAALLLALRVGRRLWHAWGLIAALMVAAIILRSLLWQQHGNDSLSYYAHIYYASWCRFDEFLPGIGLALLKHGHPRPWAWLMARGQALLVLALLACAGVAAALLQGYYTEDQGYGYAMTSFGYSLVAMAFALMMLAALSSQSWLGCCRVPGAAALAAWAYALYLSHKPIAHLLLAPLKAMGLRQDSLAMLAAISAACLLGGWLLYRGVERPFMRLRQRWVPDNFHFAAAAVAPARAATAQGT